MVDKLSKEALLVDEAMVIYEEFVDDQRIGAGTFLFLWQ